MFEKEAEEYIKKIPFVNGPELGIGFELGRCMK